MNLPEMTNALLQLKARALAFAAIKYAPDYTNLPPAELQPNKTWRTNTAFGGWWGYAEYADGAVEKKFRGFPYRLNPDWRAAHDLRTEEATARYAAERRALVVPVAGAPMKLLADEPMEKLTERVQSNSSNRDRAIVAALNWWTAQNA